MQRDLHQLTSAWFDVAVVGGGIYGACIALESVRAGFRTCLLEANDFGHGTSGSSLRILHGGLRYLQHLDLPRMRESIAARRDWFRRYPHLVRPLEFRLPTYGQGLRGPAVHFAAMQLNNIASIGSNRGVPADKHLGRASLSLDRSSLHIGGRQCFPGANGVARWYDGFMLDSERLLLEVVMDAARCGAVVANHARALELIKNENGHATGLWIADGLSPARLRVSASRVVNAAGPGWLEDSDSRAMSAIFVPARAFNLLVKRVPVEYALGVPVREQAADQDAVFRKGYRTHFIVPWGDYSLVGTKQLPTTRDPDCAVSADLVEELLSEVNQGAGFELLKMSDVFRVYEGCLPARPGSYDTLLKSPIICDHGASRGTHGLVSVSGVKWTTANSLARAIVSRLRPRNAPATLPLRVEREPVYPLPHRQIWELDLQHAVRSEMAMTLADFVFRRSSVGRDASIAPEILEEIAGGMAEMLDWSEEEKVRQLAEVRREASRMSRQLHVA